MSSRFSTKIKKCECHSRKILILSQGTCLGRYVIEPGSGYSDLNYTENIVRTTFANKTFAILERYAEKYGYSVERILSRAENFRRFITGDLIVFWGFDKISPTKLYWRY